MDSIAVTFKLVVTSENCCGHLTVKTC